MGLTGGMDPEQKKKSINEDVLMFLHKRSQTDATKYGSRLKTCMDLQQKRRRAAAARRRSEQTIKSQKTITSAKRNEGDQNLVPSERRGTEGDQRSVGKRRGDKSVKSRGEKSVKNRGEKSVKSSFFSRSRSKEPADGCSKKKRRRRRSCGKRRRRKRKRSCSRRRRRRSCRRRRKKRRRRRC
ncbi:protamine-like [Ostrinia furnacalis]|uniref:protamine-like n=1 Tax=Ostrinia furnacalis TaxID=93504 RepID=UPI00103C44CB|nr:protamine-like [Ostrinia furnacalis]